MWFRYSDRIISFPGFIPFFGIVFKKKNKFTSIFVLVVDLVLHLGSIRLVNLLPVGVLCIVVVVVVCFVVGSCLESAVVGVRFSLVVYLVLGLFVVVLVWMLLVVRSMYMVGVHMLMLMMPLG